jgi:serine protease AprX
MPSALVLALVLACVLLAGPARPVRADAFQDKSDAFLKGRLAAREAPEWSSVIVQLDRLDAGRLAQLSSLGAGVYRDLPLVKALALRVRTQRLRQLAELPFVRRVSEDVPVRKNDEFTVESSLAHTAAGQYAVTGQGVTVAVVDSGVRPHPDLTDPVTGASRILASVDFVGDAPRSGDDHGHGTHVAGIIAGNGAASTGAQYLRTFRGIAPRAGIVSLRVLDGTGSGQTSSMIAAIDWAVRNRNQYNIRVLNLSLGHPVGESYMTDPLCQAVEQAWRVGMVVVCAAGNDGRKSAAAVAGVDNEGFGTNYGSINSPANDPFVITVGAMKQDLTDKKSRPLNQIATYSGRGPSRVDGALKPDLVAPGNQVISLRSAGSTCDVSFAGNQVALGAYSTSATGESQYTRLSGTSMAAPVVAGAVALMLQKDPSLSPNTVKARLMVSADKWDFRGGTTDPCTFGAGYLNIPAALASAAVAQSHAFSPVLFRPGTQEVQVDSQRAIWGTESIWGGSSTSLNGSRAIWGVDTLDNLRAIWGTKAIWGVGTISSSSALAPDDVWMNRIIWGVSTVASESSAVSDLSVLVEGEE